MQQQISLEKQIEKVDLRNLKIVDSREPSEIRTELMKVGWVQRKLEHGDMMLWSHDYKKIIVTRKSTNDFLHSINEIFGKQLEAMLEIADICIMLIEGAWVWNIQQTQMISARGLERATKEGILNYIHRWQAKGWILERTANTADTIRRLNELYVLYSKSYSLSARSKGYADERVLGLPTGLRGSIGQKLLESRTLQQIANMDAQQILDLKVEGIGLKRANLVYEHFRKC